MTSAVALGLLLGIASSRRARHGWRWLVDNDPFCVAVDGPGDGVSSAVAGSPLAVRIGAERVNA